MTPKEQKLVDEIMRLGSGSYREVKMLEDGSIAAIGDLLFTRAIYLGCDLYGWASRFCFEDRKLADVRFAQLKSEDDEPQGYVARR